MPALFPFVQFEFPFVLGPPDGRYLVSGEPSDEPRGPVLVFRTVGAPQRRLIKGRRPKRAAATPEPEPVPSTRATAIRADRPLEGTDAGQRWLSATVSSSGERDAAVAEALVLVNRALHAYRAATANPYVHEVEESAAIAVRLGYGSGDELAEGRWTRADELPRRPVKRRRAEQLSPQERLAAVLRGRESIPPGETLILRSRLDLDSGRIREAALQASIAVDAILADPGPRKPGPQEREDLSKLAAGRDGVVAAARAALEREIGSGEQDHVADTVALAERILRRRRVSMG